MIPAMTRRLEEDEEATWRRRWIGRHAQGKEFDYSFDIYDPTKGWKSKPQLRDMKVFDNKVLNTNSIGLRGRTEHAYGKHPEKRRFVILGDSFTFGDEVSDDETYAHYLQEMIPSADIINMGVHGYGHDQMLILLKEEGIKFQPDIVLLGFVVSDMPRNLVQFAGYAKPKFVLDDYTLRISGSPVPRPEDILKWDWARPRLYDVWSALRYKWMVTSGRYDKQMKEVTKRVLDEMVVTIERAGAIAVFVYLPVGPEIYRESTMTTGEMFFANYCQGKNIECITSRPHFIQKLQQGVRFERSGHWGPLGHQTVAEAIYEYLAGKNIVPSKAKSTRVPKPEKALGRRR